MEIFFKDSIWMGLLTLIILEIILGIDNLVFITILSNKLRDEQRDKARILGLLAALIIRIGTFSLMSWSITIKKPIFCTFHLCFSLNNLILIFGGFFLIFKSILELFKILVYKNFEDKKEILTQKNFPNFWNIVFQIVLLDIIFSIDSVITAVGTVNNLTIMIVSIIFSMIVILFTSKSLTNFINKNPNILILCLIFLLLLGFNLVLEGFNIFIPKKYLYFAIIFAIFIEFFNQAGKKKLI